MSHNLKTWEKGQKGITGLETAIILIAFVIVASVLAYVVISAGLFASQKAKTAVSAGLAQSGSTIELKGNVIAVMEPAAGTDPAYVKEITFTIGVVPGGSAVDLTANPVGTTTSVNRLIIGYQDTAQQVASMFFDVTYINAPVGGTVDDMLDPGELAMVTVDLSPANNTAMTDKLVAGMTFTLSITPPDGAVLPIERTMPSRVSGLVNLY
jgi:archaeal flagellin FlaB